MPLVHIQNSTQPLPQLIQAEYCAAFLPKFQGLMLRRSIGDHAGLLLVEESDSRLNTSIHMLFMRFDIAAVWINSSMMVVDVKLARKWQPMLAPARPAKYVLELHPCQLQNFKVGDRIEITHD